VGLERSTRAAERVLTGSAGRGGPATEAVVPRAGSTADELRKLADLRDAGILTDYEFNAQKGQILGTG
jgi:hypothetical protein